MTTSSLIQPARVWLRRGSLDRSVPVQRREILAECLLLLEIADDLESQQDLKPRGIALVERLITDGNSPVYMSSPERSLHEALNQARAALHLA